MILLDLSRRQREAVGDIVKTIAIGIGRKRFPKTQVKTCQIANRMVILDPIQATNAWATGIAERLAIKFADRLLEKPYQQITVFVAGLFGILRRHLAILQTLERSQPYGPIRGNHPRILVGLQIDIAGRLVACMAAVAVLLDQASDIAVPGQFFLVLARLRK